MLLKFKYITFTCAMALLSGCSSEGSSVAPSNALVWSSCSTDSILQCAELKVPKAYNDASSGEIIISLNRLKARTQPARGSLLLNPGGPGEPGTDLLQSLSVDFTVPTAILEAYDLVSFDPRGIGKSTPITCGEFGINSLDTILTSRVEIDEFVTAATNSATQCYEKYGDYLLQIGSTNVVRDMDSIRIALKEEKLNFIGYSYGSRLAGLYLQTFPEHSGLLVLDGSVKPVASLSEMAADTMTAIQRNLDTLFEQCSSVIAGCTAQDLQQGLVSKLSQLLAEGDSGEFDFLTDLIVLAGRDSSTAESILTPLTSYVLQDESSALDGIRAEFAADDDTDIDDNTGFLAVSCADDANRPTTDFLETTFESFNADYTLVAESILPLVASCVGWPAAIEPVAEITTRTAPASLIIGGTTDANTPLVWSQEMAMSIGGHFLASSHEGHTAVFNGKSTCVDRLAMNFLLNGQLPDSENCLALPQ